MKVSLNDIFEFRWLFCILRWEMSCKETSKTQDQLFKSSWSTHQVLLNTSLTGVPMLDRCTPLIVVLPRCLMRPVDLELQGKTYFDFFLFAPRDGVCGNVQFFCSLFLASFDICWKVASLSRCSTEIQNWRLWQHWSRLNLPFSTWGLSFKVALKLDQHWSGSNLI